MKKTIISGVIFGLVAANAIAIAAPHKKLASSKALPTKSEKVAKAIKGFKVASAKTLSTVAVQPKVAVPSSLAQKAAPLAVNPSASGRASLNLTREHEKSAQGTTAMPISTAVASAKKSPFSIKYRSYNALNLVAVTNSSDSPDREVWVWDRLNLTYNFNPDISVSVMPQLFHTWFGDRNRVQDDSFGNLSQPYSAYLGNTALIFADSKIATLQGGIIWDGMARYDAPTSEWSQKAGSLGETRLATGLSKSFGRFDIKVSETYRYFLQQYTTSEAELADKKTPGWPSQNEEWYLYSLLDLGYNISKKVSISLETGFINKTKLADDNPTHQRDSVKADEIVMNPEIAVAINDNFSLALGLWEEPNMRKLKTSVYEPLNPVNGGEAYLMTTIQF